MLLAINTSTHQFSLALLEQDGTIFAEYLISPGEKHFTAFMPSIHSLFTSTKKEMDELTAIAVVIGPGSFTGLRVGLSTAKGIAQSLGIPILGVSGLEAMAYQLPYINYTICPLISSRKGELFFALFKWDNDHNLTRLKKDDCIRIDDLPDVITNSTLFLGNDYHTQKNHLQKLLKGNAFFAPLNLWNLKASAVGALGLKLFSNQCFDNLRDLVPFYMRPPDIKPPPCLTSV